MEYIYTGIIEPSSTLSTSGYHLFKTPLQSTPPPLSHEQVEHDEGDKEEEQEAVGDAQPAPALGRPLRMKERVWGAGKPMRQ